MENQIQRLCWRMLTGVEKESLLKKEDKNMDKKTTSAKALIENVILRSLELNPMELNFS
ncbi:MAG: hypothetical protein IPM47_04830 [Sphingobacteriales bacterium]|nr:MAG: hypothetical protein IPM47_04830 [Sphingobacteriales bacterium]